MAIFEILTSATSLLGGARQLVSSVSGSSGGGACPNEPSAEDLAYALSRATSYELEQGRQLWNAINGHRMAFPISNPGMMAHAGVGGDDCRVTRGQEFTDWMFGILRKYPRPLTGGHTTIQEGMARVNGELLPIQHAGQTPTVWYEQLPTYQTPGAIGPAYAQGLTAPGPLGIPLLYWLVAGGALLVLKMKGGK